jgi:hypothetical protein
MRERGRKEGEGGNDRGREDRERKWRGGKEIERKVKER